MHWGLTCRWRQSVVAQPSSSFCKYLGSGYRQKLTEYPLFDLRFLRRCLQRTASSVFGSLDRLSMTEFMVNRLKGAETRDWMSFRPALRKAILNNDLSMPHLVDVVANIIGVWPLIVSSLTETGHKDDGDSLVVRSSSFGCVDAFSYPRLLCCVSFQKKGIDRYFYLDQMARMKFRLLHLLLEICMKSHILLSLCSHGHVVAPGNLVFIS